MVRFVSVESSLHGTKPNENKAYKVGGVGTEKDTGPTVMLRSSLKTGVNNADDCSGTLLFKSLIVYEHGLDSDYERSLDLGTISKNGKGSLPMVGPLALRGKNISLYKPMPEVLSVSLHAK
jgi:hypothetical protein